MRRARSEVQYLTRPGTGVSDLGSPNQDHQAGFTAVGEVGDRGFLLCVQGVRDVRQQLLQIAAFEGTEFGLPRRATDHHRPFSDTFAVVANDQVDRVMQAIRPID